MFVSLFGSNKQKKSGKILSAARFAIDYLRNERALDRVNEVNLQKIMYFSKLVGLAELGTDIIQSDFFAWQNGPVSDFLWKEYKNRLENNDHLPNSIELKVVEKVIIEYCADKFGLIDASDASDYSHYDPERIKNKDKKGKMNISNSIDRLKERKDRMFDDYFEYAIKEAKIIDSHLQNLSN